MPIRIQNDLPARGLLEEENIFVMDENRALKQEIRPLKVGILNLMPLKEDTELQLLRSFSNTPLQVDVTFITMTNHESKNTSSSHINKFCHYLLPPLSPISALLSPKLSMITSVESTSSIEILVGTTSQRTVSSSCLDGSCFLLIR